MLTGCGAGDNSDFGVSRLPVRNPRNVSHRRTEPLSFYVEYPWASVSPWLENSPFAWAQCQRWASEGRSLGIAASVHGLNRIVPLSSGGGKPVNVEIDRPSAKRKKLLLEMSK